MYTEIRKKKSILHLIVPTVLVLIFIKNTKKTKRKIYDKIMDGAPLNLAHFHERRSDKFLKRHQFDEAEIAMENAIFHLQRSYENAKMCKSLEILDTHKWEYDRKLHQIKMRRKEYESSGNVKGIATATTVMATGTGEKTLQESNLILQQQSNKEYQCPRSYGNRANSDLLINITEDNKENYVDASNCNGKVLQKNNDDDDDMPSLDPLELPSFDYSFLPAGLAEKFQNLN